MLRTAQSILYQPHVPAAQQHRTCWCNRTVRTRGENIEVYRAVDGSNARLVGVSTCGSVWACPVCSVRICEARRVELQAAMVAHVANGGHAYLLTLTFSHGRDDELAVILDMQAAALTRFKNSRAYKGVMEQYGRIGSVRSLEVTHGENGWHPHTHDLIFARPGLDLDEKTIDRLRAAWIAAMIKVGLAERAQTSDLWKHALDLRGGQYAADYVAKFGRDHTWGMSAEITRPHSKIGTRAAAGDVHVTPFQLLAWAMDGDAKSKRLFGVFANSFQGRRMLSWSPGLKEKLGVRDLSDDELAGTPLPDEVRVGSITVEQLAIITSRAALGEFHEYIAVCVMDENTGQSDIDEWIAQLGRRPPSHGANVRVRRFMGRGYSEIYAGIDPAAPRLREARMKH